MQTKKSLGQHFLKERVFAERLAAAISEGTKNLVEVGPGPGMLTGYLIDRCERLLLIEKDTLMAQRASEMWAAHEHVTVVEGDILTYDFGEVFDDEPFTIVGNFPYNISSQIVFRALHFWDRVPELIGMFQYEMARRIVTGPGSKEYGKISVLAAARYAGRLLFSVPPGAFNPPPKVNSAVICLRRKDDFNLRCRFVSLQIVTRAAFGQRRKMLRNSLRALLPDDILTDALYEQRPEQLSLDQFIEIALIYEAREDK